MAALLGPTPGAQFDELVDLMLFDGEEGVSKPDVRIYQRALMRLNIQPYEAVFVDDKESNIEPAKNLGMFVVHFKNTAQAIQDIAARLLAEAEQRHANEAAQRVTYEAQIQLERQRWQAEITRRRWQRQAKQHPS